MSRLAGAAETAVRWVAFAEPEAARWGAAWLSPAAPPTGLLALGAQASAGPMELAGAGADEPWRLSGSACELVLEGVTDPVWSDPDAPEQGFDQLCRVTGQIECLGWRSSRPTTMDSQADSFRLLTAWFDAADGFSVLALRPRKAKGQDQDSIQGVLVESGGAQRVADPRFSTTYTGSGQPARAGVELWIPAEPDSENLYPRRALGEALAPPVQWTAADLTLQAQPFRWFSGGREGPGVYLLGRR